LPVLVLVGAAITTTTVLIRATEPT
jgi:hypothetical protein